MQTSENDIKEYLNSWKCRILLERIELTKQAVDCVLLVYEAMRNFEIFSNLIIKQIYSNDNVFDEPDFLPL